MAQLRTNHQTTREVAGVAPAAFVQRAGAEWKGNDGLFPVDDETSRAPPALANLMSDEQFRHVLTSCNEAIADAVKNHAVLQQQATQKENCIALAGLCLPPLVGLLWALPVNAKCGPRAPGTESAKRLAAAADAIDAAIVSFCDSYNAKNAHVKLHYAMTPTYMYRVRGHQRQHHDMALQFVVPAAAGPQVDYGEPPIGQEMEAVPQASAPPGMQMKD